MGRKKFFLLPYRSMATALKKHRKLRGKVSAGHGRIGKHRKHPGGKGNAGLLTHRRTRLCRYHPGLIGKIGIKKPNNSSGFRYSNATNIEKLAHHVPEEYRTPSEDGTVPKINLTELGYTKVLGKGKLGLK